MAVSSLKQTEDAGTFQDWLHGVERNLDDYSPEFREWLKRRRDGKAES